MEARTAFRRTAWSKSVALVITVLTGLMLAVGTIAASGLVKDALAADLVSREGRDRQDLELTYTVWFSPAMTGVVGGDFVGTFGGSVVSTPIPGSPIVRLMALYVITANDASRSFTAVVKGKLNTQTNSAVLKGVVTSGSSTGERVHSEFQVLSTCPLHPAGPCFQGTMSVS